MAARVVNVKGGLFLGTAAEIRSVLETLASTRGAAVVNVKDAQFLVLPDGWAGAAPEAKQQLAGRIRRR